ncbi:MAG: ABA4-like family protein [Henriciella sp.]
MMSWETGFIILNLMVLPAWALLLILPRSNLTRTAVHSMLWPIVMGAIYATSLIAAMVFGLSDPDAGFTLSGVQALFSHPNGVILGWSHYLVFDLFVGAWIARDGQRRAIAHWKLIPCLLGAFLFGPVGLLLYAILRWLSGHRFTLQES